MLRSLFLALLLCCVAAQQAASSTVEDGPMAKKPAPFPAGAKSAIPDNYSCINCHTDLEDEVLTPPVKDWMQSVHREVGVKCADCHGGAPFNEDLAMEPEAGFIGKPKPMDIPKLCSKCHSDAKLMRAYNQRADQYQLYSSSVHGRKLSSGDEQAPSCVSCHGKHKILRVKDPKSTVHRANIPKTCGGCHAKKEIFKKRRKPFNQLDMYKKSRHYELFSKGDLLVPTCVNCHGNHGVISPKSARVRTVCFNCHASQAEYFKSSPHWKVYEKQGEPICLSCHNNHDVLRPTVKKFTGDKDIDCIGCHDKTDKAYKAGEEIQAIMISTISAVAKAREGLDDFINNAHGGFEVSALVENMDKTADNLKELNSLTHKLDVETLKKQSGKIINASRKAQETIDQMWAEIHTRKIGLAVSWVVFFGFCCALWLKSKSLERHR